MGDRCSSSERREAGYRHRWRGEATAESEVGQRGEKHRIDTELTGEELVPRAWPYESSIFQTLHDVRRQLADSLLMGVAGRGFVIERYLLHGWERG
ncbi:hypothetical protein RRF57_012174 [Xylaria bambusicola]|uniref:Uncharacterized protein n=1 Tax=Xylaria bambusicola TaxID=326684 RepID=A0AAN7UW24_9PEZI